MPPERVVKVQVHARAATELAVVYVNFAPVAAHDERQIAFDEPARGEVCAVLAAVERFERETVERAFVGGVIERNFALIRETITHARATEQAFARVADPRVGFPTAVVNGGERGDSFGAFFAGRAEAGGFFDRDLVARVIDGNPLAVA